jgi:hypothetical protein
MSHTPGPWFVGDPDRAGARVWATQHGADGVVCARIENRDNARLIAAAPDLLHNLREMVALFGTPNDGMERDIVEAAEAAIAKAKS